MRYVTFAGAIIAAGLACGSAAAGDYADLEILGFSPDGRSFAFEEYGVQDGSGFPYSNIYVIDTTSDHWVAGTPVRVLAQNEATPLQQARTEAGNKARPILAARQIGAPGNHVASNPPTEISADPHRVIFLPRNISPMGGTAYELDLTEITLPADNCPDMGQPFKGFSLTLTTANSPTQTLASDSAIPVQPPLPARLCDFRCADVFPRRRPAGARRHPRHVHGGLRGSRPALPGNNRAPSRIGRRSPSIVNCRALC